MRARAVRRREPKLTKTESDSGIVEVIAGAATQIFWKDTKKKRATFSKNFTQQKPISLQ